MYEKQDCTDAAGNMEDQSFGFSACAARSTAVIWALDVPFCDVDRVNRLPSLGTKTNKV